MGVTVTRRRRSEARRSWWRRRRPFWGKGMTRKGPVRIGGVAGVAAGAAYYAAGVADLLSLAPGTARWPGPVVFASSPDYLVQVLLVAGLAGTPLAVAGLLLRARWRSARGRGRGWLWAVGSSAVLLGHALLLLSALTALTRGAATGPAPFAVGYPLALVGAVVLGGTAVVLDARVLPRWCGLLLVFGYSLAALPGASWAGSWMMLGCVWASVGYALLLSGGELPARAVPRARRGRDGTVRGRLPSARQDPAHPRGGVGARPRRARRAPRDGHADLRRGGG